jgi:multidrug resistance protein, MATE family
MLQQTIPYKEHIRKTLVLAIPVCISNLGHIMVGIVDAAFVGRIHESATGYSATVAQAAVSLANSLYMLVLVFGMGISYGITPLVAAADGEKNNTSLGALLKNGLLINTLTGILLYLLLTVISPVLYLFGQSEEVVKLSIPFLNVMILGMIPLMIFNTFKQFTEGLSNTATAMLVTIGCNLLNILFNWMFIFGKWGFEPMGLMGSCWASFVSRVIMAIAMFIYIYAAVDFKPYWVTFKQARITTALCKKILNLGVPSGLQWLFEVGAFSFALVMIGWIGPVEQAAHLIALSIAAATYMVASGLSAAVSVRVGNQAGLKNQAELRRAGFTGFLLVTLLMSCFAVLFISCRFILTVSFNENPAVVNTAAALLVIAAFFQLSDGIQVVALGALRGVKDTLLPTVITLIAYWAFGLPCSYLLAFKMDMGVYGVWYGLLIGLTATAIMLLLRFNYISKKVTSS